MAAAKKAIKRRRKNVLAKGAPTPREVAADPPAKIRELGELVESDGGKVLSSYRDPYGGQWLLLAALPLERVSRTPYQRDVSDAHVRRLGAVISKVGRFLDPVIATRNDDGSYFSPNGGHRLQALAELDARTVTALLVPEPEVATKILALNTEKAHNLREKSLEVIRMARSIAEASASTKEGDLALEFEEAPLLTLGACYERKGNFGGGAYHGLLKRTDAFLDLPLSKSIPIREARAETVMAVDARVGEIVKELQARGLVSPYLRAFVVARCNPLRFAKRETAAFDPTWKKVADLAARFEAEKIKPGDVARTGGPPPTADE